MIESDWTKISERLDRTSGCWRWPGSADKNGYGMARIAGRKVRIHRPVYEHFRGPIPAGLEIDHLCRNPACINPFHLEAVTHRENVLRGASFAAHYAYAESCKHGHMFTPANTIRHGPNGEHRKCRMCKRRTNARWRAARKSDPGSALQGEGSSGPGPDDPVGGDAVAAS